MDYQNFKEQIWVLNIRARKNKFSYLYLKIIIRFKLPDDDEVFLMQDRKPMTSLGTRSQTRVWEKTTASCRNPLKKTFLSEPEGIEGYRTATAF